MRLLEVYRINKENIAEDCAQVMIDFFENLEIKNCKTDHVMFYLDKSTLNNYKNDYLEDDRRKKFPYSNIPVHREISGFIKYNVTNQVFEYNNIYQLNHFYRDYTKDPAFGKTIDHFTYLKVIKDKDSALMLEGAQNLLFDINAEKIHDLEALGIVKIEKIKDPQIPILLNRNISNDEIIKAKKLVKEKRAQL